MDRPPLKPPPFGVCQICGEMRPLAFVDVACEDVSARHEWEWTLFLHVTHCNDRKVCAHEAENRIAAYARGEDVKFLKPDRARSGEVARQASDAKESQCPPPKAK